VSLSPQEDKPTGTPSPSDASLVPSTDVVLTPENDIEYDSDGGLYGGPPTDPKDPRLTWEFQQRRKWEESAMESEDPILQGQALLARMCRKGTEMGKTMEEGLRAIFEAQAAGEAKAFSASSAPKPPPPRQTRNRKGKYRWQPKVEVKALEAEVSEAPVQKQNRPEGENENEEQEDEEEEEEEEPEVMREGRDYTQFKGRYHLLPVAVPVGDSFAQRIPLHARISGLLLRVLDFGVSGLEDRIDEKLMATFGTTFVHVSEVGTHTPVFAVAFSHTVIVDWWQRVEPQEALAHLQRLLRYLETKCEQLSSTGVQCGLQEDPQSAREKDVLQSEPVPRDGKPGEAPDPGKQVQDPSAVPSLALKRGKDDSRPGKVRRKARAKARARAKAKARSAPERKSPSAAKESPSRREAQQCREPTQRTGV
jgi:hypothetical protein